jgi:hypothetical protein
MADKLVYVPVGSDRFRALVVAQACRAAGIRVQLLTSDDSGVRPHFSLMQDHRLLVAKDDVPRVEEIIARTSGSRR